MAAHTKDQALDLVAAIFVRAGERAKAQSVRSADTLGAPRCDVSEREAA